MGNLYWNNPFFKVRFYSFYKLHGSVCVVGGSGESEHQLLPPGGGDGAAVFSVLMGCHLGELKCHLLLLLRRPWCCLACLLKVSEVEGQLPAVAVAFHGGCLDSTQHLSCVLSTINSDPFRALFARTISLLCTLCAFSLSPSPSCCRTSFKALQGVLSALRSEVTYYYSHLLPFHLSWNAAKRKHKHKLVKFFPSLPEGGLSQRGRWHWRLVLPLWETISPSSLSVWDVSLSLRLFIAL